MAVRDELFAAAILFVDAVKVYDVDTAVILSSVSVVATRTACLAVKPPPITALPLTVIIALSSPELLKVILPPNTSKI